MSSEVVIRVKNLTKSYKLYDDPMDRLKEALHPFRKKYHHNFTALKGLSFEFSRGQTLGVIGSNGSGKSTLLKILSNVLTPTSGEIEVKGKIAALLELGAGFNPELTGIQNIYFNGALMGFTEAQMAEKVQSILDFADIGEFVHQQVRLYSSGMFARLAFAVAVSVAPDVLIVDEALSVGDAGFALKCLNKMNEIAKAGSTIIFVSHDIHSVKTFCDKVLWINKGDIQQFGDSSSTCSAYLEFMFSGNLRDSQLHSKANLDRWGTGEVLVENYHLKKMAKSHRVFDFGDEIEVEIEAISKINKKSGRIGFSIKNEKALDIINWMSDEIEFSEGKSYKLNLFFKNILAPGKYFLILVIDDLPNGKYYDYIENAISFEVIADKTIHSLVLPEVKVVIS